MMNGMTTGAGKKGKIAVSMPQEMIEALHRAVDEGRAPSASAFVADAVGEKLSRDDLEALLAEMLEETGGPPTPEEIAEVDALLGL